jgi:hypothetical protein
MPDENTKADALRLYISGAGSDGGAQTDHDAALGNYRSSTELGSLGITVTSPISDVDVDYASGHNGTGAGTLTASGSDELTWTPPGGSAGAGVTISNGETKILEGGGASSKTLRVSRTSATALTGAATVTLADVANNAVGFDNILSADATAGDDEYRAIFLKNGSVANMANLTIWIGTLGTQVTSDASQLGASGSGTIQTTGTLADWPLQGYAHVRDSGGTTREIVYYTSRTDTVLTVPTAGRGLLGTSAAAGAATDSIDAVPGIRIAQEDPSAQTTGYIQTIADEDSAPTGRTWNSGITAADGIAYGTLETGEILGLWLHRNTPAGAVADPAILHLIRASFDAA